MYRPLKPVTWYYTEDARGIPQTTTHEMLENGLAKRKLCRASIKKKLPIRELWHDNTKVEKRFELPITSSYRRDYSAPYIFSCSIELRENMPDPLWNRKPLNHFASGLCIASTTKFTDDNWLNITPERKRVDFFRQIRNQHTRFT